MQKRFFISLIICVLVFISTNKNMYGVYAASQARAGVFERIYKKVKEKEGVKKISYVQFLKIRTSGEQFVLLDAREIESFNAGHIEGAVSFPAWAMDKESIKKRLLKDSRIITYCEGPACHASACAAKEILDCGYMVLDYSGGVKEWQSKGNKLIASQ
jgi:rhodanese-related sulfurtransferase